MSANRIRTPLCTVPKLINHHGAEHDVASLDRLPAGDQTAVALPQQGNAGVGVREQVHSKVTRSSKCPWGARCSSGIEPATRSKKPLGHPFSSTSPPGTSGIT